MTLPFFYADPGDIDSGAGRLTLTGSEARHLALSLRARPDDRVLVADGRGEIYRASLTVVGPEKVKGLIESRRHVEEELPGIIMFQAVARITKMDEAVARAAEAGIAAVVPFVTQRSPAGSATRALHRLQRWRKIALQESKVARRAFPLSVAETVEWPIDGRVLGGQEANFILWENESSMSLREALPDIPPRSLGLVVGPEGGFEPNEVSVMGERGAVPVSIGDLILRTETAGAYVAMLIRYNYHLLEPLEV